MMRLWTYDKANLRHATNARYHLASPCQFLLDILNCKRYCWNFPAINAAGTNSRLSHHGWSQSCHVLL